MERATDEDRKHFCSYPQALAAIPEELPFTSNGHRHVAVNLSTGHRIPCSDAYIAAGYVAGSAVLFPQHRFALEMGTQVVPAFAAHPRFRERLSKPDWAAREEQEHEQARMARALEAQAQRAWDQAMARGLDDDEPY